MKNESTAIPLVQNVIRGIECVASLLNEIKEVVKINMHHIINYLILYIRSINKFYPSNISEKEDYTIEDVENDYIKSRLAVQMKITAEEYSCTSSYVRINYVNALKNMLINARKHYPEKYPKK